MQQRIFYDHEQYFNYVLQFAHKKWKKQRQRKTVCNLEQHGKMDGHTRSGTHHKMQKTDRDGWSCTFTSSKDMAPRDTESCDFALFHLLKWIWSKVRLFAFAMYQW